jgi:hypothetical protein
MRKRLGKGRWLALAAVLLVPVAGAAITQATGNGVIHSCSAKSGGALRLAKKCKSSEKPLSWNRTGPRGAAGAAGSAGAKGDPGSAGATGPTGAKGDPGATGGTGQQGGIGPSDAYVDRQDAILALDSGGAATQVAALTLPAGAYAFSAKLVADNDSNSSSRIDCSLIDPNATGLDYVKLKLAPTGGENLEFANISLTGASIIASGNVKVTCQLDNTGSNVTVGWRKLVATKVGAVH